MPGAGRADRETLEIMETYLSTPIVALRDLGPSEAIQCNISGAFEARISRVEL
jgi:hypothetical protein